MNLELDSYSYIGSGNLLDTSINTNNATISGATFNNANKFFNFDGINDSISVAHSSIFNPTTSSFSLEAWIYPTSSSTSQIIIAKTAGSSTNSNWGYGLRIISGDLWFQVSSGVGAVNILVPSLTLNRWHHVIGVYDMNGNYTIYLNGIDEARAKVYFIN